MTQSPIEPRHKDMAAKAVGFRDWDNALANGYKRVVEVHAQTLANLEAARAENEAFRREVSDAMLGVRSFIDGDSPLTTDRLGTKFGVVDFSRFIIPASDPVAEALREAIMAYGCVVNESDPQWPEALAKFRAFIEGDR